MKTFAILICLLICGFPLHASGREESKVKLAYDVGFEMNFDNREYYKSDFSESMTIFGARLSPSVGLSIGREHKVMLGVDVMKDFGSPDRDVLGETLLYYKMDKTFSDTRMELYAGIFSRKVSGTSVSPTRAFFHSLFTFSGRTLCKYFSTSAQLHIQQEK